MMLPIKAQQRSTNESLKEVERKRKKEIENDLK